MHGYDNIKGIHWIKHQSIHITSQSTDLFQLGSHSHNTYLWLCKGCALDQKLKNPYYCLNPHYRLSKTGAALLQKRVNVIYPGSPIRQHKRPEKQSFQNRKPFRNISRKKSPITRGGIHSTLFYWRLYWREDSLFDVDGKPCYRIADWESY